MNEQIIHSVLQNDAYKFSMGNCTWLNHPHAEAEFEFACRTDADLIPLLPKICEQVEAMRGLRLTPSEATYLRTWGYLDHRYVSWLLDSFRFDPDDLTFFKDSSVKGGIRIKGKGEWPRVSMWEIPILAIVSALETERQMKTAGLSWDECEDIGFGRLDVKLHKLAKYPQIKPACFCLRRCAHPEWQEKLLRRWIEKLPDQLAGTSNVYLAKKLGVKHIGTMAHEMFMGMLALVARPELAQPAVLHLWLQTYKDKLGDALTDTFTTEAFWHDFNIVLAREFVGLRHDSADPFAFARRAIQHYESLGIDPKSKKVIWSDSLTVDAIIALWLEFVGRIGCAFGWGTDLGNDIGLRPLQIVMKLMRMNGRGTCKKSDVPGKIMEGEPGVADMVDRGYLEAYGLALKGRP